MVCGSCYMFGTPKKGGITGVNAVLVLVLFAGGALFVPMFLLSMYVVGGLIGMILLGAIVSAVAGQSCRQCGGRDLVPVGTPRAAEIGAKAPGGLKRIPEPKSYANYVAGALAILIASILGTVLIGRYLADRRAEVYMPPDATSEPHERPLGWEGAGH